MVNYTSTASLGGGRFAPSVNYNAAVRMPTQPIPDLKQPNSEFNIDLRSLSQAMLGAKELEVKGTIAEKEMLLKKQMAEAEAEASRNLKLAEWEMKERHHRDKMLLDYAKLEKKDKDNTAKTYELNSAIKLYNKRRDILDAELKADKLNPDTYSLELRKLWDDVSSGLVYNEADALATSINVIRPGAVNLVPEYIRDREANIEAGRKQNSEERQNSISNVMHVTGATTAEAVEDIEKTENSYRNAMETFQRIQNPPSVLLDSQKEEWQSQQLKELDRNLGVIGGSKVLYEFSKSINDIRSSGNVAESVENLRQSFESTLLTIPGVDRSRIDLLWNIYKDMNNIDELVENTVGLKEQIGKEQTAFINRAVKNKKIDLINDQFIGDFLTTTEAFPWLADLYVNNLANFNEVTAISNAIINANLSLAVPVKNGWMLSFSDGSSFMLDNKTATKMMQSTGTDNVRDALLVSNIQASNKLRAEGKHEDATRVGKEGFKQIAKDKAESVQDVINKAHNIEQALDPIDPKYLKDDERTALLKTGSNKMLVKYGRGTLADIHGKIAYLIPDGFASDYLKGGKLYIIPNKDQSLTLYRYQTGAGGGLGEDDFIKKNAEVVKYMQDAGLTRDEMIIQIETALNENGELYEVKEEGWAPSPWELLKHGLQGIVRPIEWGAKLDTKLTELFASLALVENVRDLKYIWRNLTNDAKTEIKDTLRAVSMNRNNPEFIRGWADVALKSDVLKEDNKPIPVEPTVQPKSERPGTTVNSVSEMQKIVDENAKKKKKSEENSDVDIITPPPMTNVVDKGEKETDTPITIAKDRYTYRNSTEDFDIYLDNNLQILIPVTPGLSGEALQKELERQSSEYSNSEILGEVN